MSNTNYFLLRRLHSLLGIIPLGIFLFNHLLTNSTGFLGSEAFEHKVSLIHMLGPFLPLVEAVVIFIPLALHIGLGIYIALTSKRKEMGLGYWRNWAYNFQRWTGWLALVFIVYHVVHLRFLHPMDQIPFSFVLADMFSGSWAWLIVPGYLIGALSVIFHFANGICTFCMTWGITTGPASQRGMAFVAAGVGAVITALLFASIIGFYREGVKFRTMSIDEKEQLVEDIGHHHHDLNQETALEYLVQQFGR